MQDELLQRITYRLVISRPKDVHVPCFHGIVVFHKTSSLS